MDMNRLDQAASGESTPLMPEGGHVARLLELTAEETSGETIFVHMNWKIVAGPRKGEEYRTRTILKSEANLEIFTGNIARLEMKSKNFRELMGKIKKSKPICDIQVSHKAPFTNVDILARRVRVAA